MGAIVLHQGKIAEMATGEGKTLVAIMPLYLNSLPGRGAHLVTVNDYLAKRDAQWMGGVLEFLGCKVGYILGEMTPEERRVAYACDVTYGTNNEFGFDYLRDNMVVHPEHLVHREFYYAIVDEVDSVLIDEARTPLIIRGAVDKSTHQFTEMNPRVQNVVRGQMKIVNDWLGDVERALRAAADGEDVKIDDETALKLLRISRGAPKNQRFRKLGQIPGVLETIQRTEENYMRDKAMWEADSDLLYVVEEKNHHVDLTEKGREVFAREDRDFFVLPDLAESAGAIQNDESLHARREGAAPGGDRAGVRAEERADQQRRPAAARVLALREGRRVRRAGRQGHHRRHLHRAPAAGPPVQRGPAPGARGQGRRGRSSARRRRWPRSRSRISSASTRSWPA